MSAFFPRLPRVVPSTMHPGATPSDPPTRRPLRLYPFRGMRYNPSVVKDLGSVTSMPYDVMDRTSVDEALRAHPYNIVRLILPRLVSDPNQADPYARAANLLKRWRAKSVLVTDETPSLYVYEYGDRAHSVCGLVGALGLRPPKARVILPHEGVTRGIVADRFAMLASTRANLEPILLVYDGDGATAEPVEAARSGQPLVDVNGPDGTFHRLWAITDAERLVAIRRALARQQALIADGHHRYATYRLMRQHRRHSGQLAGPWDRGLALLIDQSHHPLTLGAIHRSIADMTLSDLRSPPGLTMSDPYPVDDPTDLPPPRRGTMTVTDGRGVRRLTRPVDAGDERDDIDILNEVVLPAWSVADSRVTFHHEVAQTLTSAQVDAGVAVLLAPPTVEHIMQLARSGRMMPRKSTSFGPKPRMGIVMRHFDDEVS